MSIECTARDVELKRLFHCNIYPSTSNTSVLYGLAHTYSLNCASGLNFLSVLDNFKANL